ncbi:MAG TPA: PAS domain-containing protein [Alphaproteobacteria bacterium]
MTLSDLTPATSPISDARLKEGYAYWQRKAGDRRMPRRADIDPTEIPKLLPHVMLVDVLEGGRYRYRLIGTENERAHGINATGRCLDEVLKGPEYKRHVLGLYDKVVGERRAVYSECLFLSPEMGAAERHTKVLFMPLSEDGESVNLVFVMQVFLYLDQATRDRHFIDARPYQEIASAVL